IYPHSIPVHNLLSILYLILQLVCNLLYPHKIVYPIYCSSLYSIVAKFLSSPPHILSDSICIWSLDSIHSLSSSCSIVPFIADIFFTLYITSSSYKLFPSYSFILSITSL